MVPNLVDSSYRWTLSHLISSHFISGCLWFMVQPHSRCIILGRRLCDLIFFSFFIFLNVGSSSRKHAHTQRIDINSYYIIITIPILSLSKQTNYTLFSHSRACSPHLLRINGILNLGWLAMNMCACWWWFGAYVSSLMRKYGTMWLPLGVCGWKPSH